MADRAGRRGRRQGRRSRPLRAGARAPLRRAAGAHRRDARQPAGPAQDQPDRRARARHPRRVSRPPCWPRLQTLEPPTLEGRTDLRALASPHHRSRRRARPRRCRARRARQPIRDNGGGFIVHVAIADVAHYVRPGARARPRGAAARQLGLFPRPRRADAARAHLQRPVLAARRARSGPASPRAWCSTGTATRSGHTFLRAMMRSAAKLSYEEAQAAIDGQPSAQGRAAAGARRSSRCGRPMPRWRPPATGASRSISTCPSARSCSTATAGSSASYAPERLDAHRLIEEFMIQANVAAAETLEAKRARRRSTACTTRPPRRSSRRCASSWTAWISKLPGAGRCRPGDFNQRAAARQGAARRRPRQRGGAALAVAGRLRGREHRPLRPPPAPLRAFHLADPPLRRSHRASLADPRAGPGRRRARPTRRPPGSPDIAQAISDAERRAMAAERETTDRLIAAYLADRVGAEFAARISGVTRSGLFVRLQRHRRRRLRAGRHHRQRLLPPPRGPRTR